MRTRQFTLRLLAVCYAFLLLCSQDLLAFDQPTKTITDIAHWKHPVHTVFQENKIEITKVEFFDGGKYPVFFAKLTFDPASSETEKFYNKLYYRVLEANGFWDYAIKDTEDQAAIKIHWDKQSKTLTKTFEDTVDKKD